MNVSLYNNRELCSSKGRLYFYDNAKFILILLVVLAHYLSPLMTAFPAVRVLWLTINSFHMPAFIFISGFFAKSYIAPDRTIKVQRTSTYIILFLVSQLAVSMFEWFVLGEKFPFSLTNARSSLWFLQCLIIWHLVLPYVARFKASITIPASIIMALYIGYETQCGNFMALSRVFVHFPFFLCGYYCAQATLEKLFLNRIRIPLLLAGAAIVTLYAVFPKLGVGKLLTSNYPYALIDGIHTLPAPLYWAARLGFYAAAFILGAAFLSIIPRGKVLYSSLGSKSLSVYILHRFVYLAELHYNWANHFKTPLGAVLLGLIAIACTILFSVKPFTVPFDWLQKIRIDRLLRKDAEDKSAVTEDNHRNSKIL